MGTERVVEKEVLGVVRKWEGEGVGEVEGWRC